MVPGLALSRWQTLLTSGPAAVRARDYVVKAAHPVQAPAELGAFVNNQALAAARATNRIPVVRLEADWPVRPLPHIDSAAIRTWVEHHGTRPVAYVQVPAEQRDLAVVPMPHLDGHWGVFGVTSPLSRVPPWARYATYLGIFRARALRTLWIGLKELGLERWDTMTRDPSLYSTALRHGTEEELLQRKDEVTARWRGLRDTDPVVREWFALSGPGVHESWSEVRPWLERVTVHEVARLFGEELNYERFPESAITDLNAWLTSLGFTITIIDGVVRITPPSSFAQISTPPTWTEMQRHFEAVSRHAPTKDLEKRLLLGFQEAALLPFLFFDFAGETALEGGLTTYTLESRCLFFEAALGGRTATVMDALGTHFLSWLAPNGLALSSIRTQLTRNQLTGRPTVVGHQLISAWYPYAWRQPRLRSLVRAMAKDRLGAVSWIHPIPVEHEVIPPAYPFQPIEDPMRISPPPRGDGRWHVHPYETLKSEWEGAYQAMQLVSDGPVILHPAAEQALHAHFGPALDGQWRFTIVPDPAALPADEAAQLTWMFTGMTGRAAMQYLGPTGCTIDGVRYRHLKRIGVGQTHLVRMECANAGRDGYTDQRRAMNRWYCAWALQTMARKAGMAVRIPYVAGIWNHGVARDRRGDDAAGVTADLKTTVFELCREIICLEALYAPPDIVEALLCAAKTPVMEELGHATMSLAGYLEWLARTMGEQFALLSAFHFDHGYERSSMTAQLHPDNFTLGGEVKDLETGRFTKTVEAAAVRYRRGNARLLAHHITLEALLTMHRDPDSWLARILGVVPGVPFAKFAQEAFAEAQQVLAHRAINPRDLRTAFNREEWNPFMRAHTPQFQARV